MKNQKEVAKAMLDAFYNILNERIEDDSEMFPGGPVMFEDEIAEVLTQHKGEMILVYFNPAEPIKFRYYFYERDKYIVFAIYDALENDCLVTVNGTDIRTL